MLYGLYSIVKLHFAKEEEIYLPILDNHLSEGDAHELFHKSPKSPTTRRITFFTEVNPEETMNSLALDKSHFDRHW